MNFPAPIFDPVAQVLIQLSDYPDVRLQRWDGAIGVRAATSAETTAYDAAVLDAQAQTRVVDKLIQAILIYLVQRLNELRTQPITAFTALTAQNVKDGIVAIYKTL